MARKGKNSGGAGDAQQQRFFTVRDSEKQTAVIYDALSEGPIEGLVNGPSSIMLNGVPIVENSINSSFSATTSRSVSYNHSTGVVTDNTSNMFTNRDINEGTFSILIEGAKKSGSGIASTTEGSTVVSTSSSFFTSDDIRSSKALPQYVSIEGAGVDGCHYIGEIVQVVSATSVRVQPAVPKTVSSKNITVDLVDTISSFSGNTATLTNGGGVSVTTVYAQLSTPTQTRQSTPKFNFEQTSFAFRNGYRDQTYIPGMFGLGSASTPHAINASLQPTDFGSLSGFSDNYFADGGWKNVSEAGASATIKTASTDMGVAEPSEVDQVNITIKFPGGLYAHKAKSGHEAPSFAEFQIFFEYTRDGSNFISELIMGPTDSQLSTRAIKWGGRAGKPISPSNGYFTANTKTSFVKTISIDTERFQPFSDYRIKINRITPSNARHGDYTHYSATQLQAIENIIEDKLSYPYLAYGAVHFAAQDFTNVPKRSYEIRGLKVKVPTNYFSRHELGEGQAASYTRNITTGANTGSYTDWDGNFRGDIKTFTSKTSANYNPVWTDNPVWILMDVLTNDRYGLGKYIDPDDNFSNIDKYQLFQLAKYCDELVPDGKGGTEPRFSCNVYFQTITQAQTMIADLISAFRGLLVYFDSEISPTINADKSPVYTFTKGNIVDGMFTYQGSSRRFRSNQIRVTWNNPDNAYKQEVEIVEDFENVIKTGKINPKEVVAFGCTSRGQAHRFGKWHLLTEKLEKEVVTFTTGINAGFLKPGDVIQIQDADITNTQSSGRVSSSGTNTTTRVFLDRAISLSGSSTHQLNLIYPSGGAYLAQDVATINSVNYRKGDLVLVDESGAAIDTHPKSVNVKDDSNNLVHLFWSEETRVETKTISSFNASGDVTVSSAFSAVPNSEVIWSITETTAATGSETEASPKDFVVAAIREETEATFSITAVEYAKEKFELVDRGYVIDVVPEERRPAVRTDDVPAPTSLALSISSFGESSLAEEADIDASGINLNVSWEHPVVDNKKYKHLAGYEVRNDVIEGQDGNVISIKKVGAEVSSYVFKNVQPGVYTIEVRTKNNQGNYSKYVQRRINIDSSKELITNKSRIGRIPKGGLLNTSLSITSGGTLSFGSGAYRFENTVGTGFSFTNAASANKSQAFGLGNNEEAFLVFDADATSDHLKALQVIDNTTATDADGNKLLFEYVAEVGASNSGLTAISGTATLSAGDTQVTGSSTTFTSHFSPGDRIFLSSGTSLFMAKVTFVDSDTKLQIDRVSTRAYSGVTASKLSFVPNFIEDTILAKVVTDGSGNHTISEEFVVSAGVIGADGADGLKQVQGYLYYEKTSNTGVAPSTPGSTTYTFSTGDIDGGSGATEVLALADTSATDKWTNSPRTQDVGSTSSFWTVRYSGGQSAPTDATCTVTYSAIVKQTAFTGVVTFSGGTFSEDGSAITTIDGANIDTGTITANKIQLSDSGGLTIGSLTNDSNFITSAQAPVQSVNGSTGAVSITASGLNITSSEVSGLSDAATTSVSSILGGTFTGNVTGTIGGTAANTVKSGAAAGATANQDSTATILAGNLTGSVDGTAVGTIKSGAALGATANQSTNAQIVQTLFTASTSITAGRIKLTSGTTQFLSNDTTAIANNSIDIQSNSSDGGPRIVIADSS